MLLQMRVTADGQFVPAAVETRGSALDKIIAPPPQALPGGTLRREFNRLVSERRWARAGQIPRGTFQSNYESSRAISQSNLFILASILKRHLIDRQSHGDKAPRRDSTQTSTPVGTNAALFRHQATAVGGYCTCGWMPLLEEQISGRGRLGMP